MYAAMPILKLQEAIEANGYRGVDPEEAYELCLKAYGNEEQAEEVRCQRMRQIMDEGQKS